MHWGQRSPAVPGVPVTRCRERWCGYQRKRDISTVKQLNFIRFHRNIPDNSNALIRCQVFPGGEYRDILSLCPHNQGNFIRCGPGISRRYHCADFSKVPVGGHRYPLATIRPFKRGIFARSQGMIPDKSTYLCCRYRGKFWI